MRYTKSKCGHEIRQWLSANKLCMRFFKPMKEWLKWDETWYVYQVRYAESKYGHKISQWLSANKLCMRFVKPMKVWLNEIKLVTYIKWGILSPNMVMKLNSDCQIINYSWDLSNLWRSGWNEMKLGTYIRWGMLNPNMVMKLDSDCQIIPYSWDFSNLWRSCLKWDET